MEGRHVAKSVGLDGQQAGVVVEVDDLDCVANVPEPTCRHSLKLIPLHPIQCNSRAEICRHPSSLLGFVHNLVLQLGWYSDWKLCQPKPSAIHYPTSV